MKFRALGFPTRGNAAAPLLLLILLHCFPCFSQSGAGTPPPPGHLPRMLFECESGSGFSSCSVWMWQGAAYSAIWSNGATGQLTVQSGNAAEIQFQRVDAAGPAAGLNATYSGKWDGSSVKDGKLSFTFKGASGSGVWTGVPEATPVVHSNLGTVLTEQQRELSYFEPPNAPYINWYTSDLTGYTIRTHGVGGSTAISTVIEDFRVRGERPMKTGERRQIAIFKAVPVPANYDKGTAYRYGEAIAAIFADGSTFGDRNMLAEMLERRRSMIAALTGIGTTVCTLGGQHAPVADIAAALDKQHADEDARAAAGQGVAKETRDAAYSYVGKALGHVNTRLTASQAAIRILDEVNQLRSGLAADPVKDASGQLAIPPVAPLACSLP